MSLQPQVLDFSSGGLTDTDIRGSGAGQAGPMRTWLRCRHSAGRLEQQGPGCCPESTAQSRSGKATSRWDKGSSYPLPLSMNENSPGSEYKVSLLLPLTLSGTWGAWLMHKGPFPRVCECFSARKPQPPYSLRLIQSHPLVTTAMLLFSRSVMFGFC